MHKQSHRRRKDKFGLLSRRARDRLPNNVPVLNLEIVLVFVLAIVIDLVRTIDYDDEDDYAWKVHELSRVFLRASQSKRRLCE
jgi:hypothetical protein